MKSKYYLLKEKAIALRSQGKSYSEIRKIINEDIPKSTLSTWCHAVYLSSEQKEHIDKIVKENSKKGMEAARIANRARREKYLQSIVDRNQHLSLALKDVSNAKIVLSILYLAEGAKNIKRGSLYLGNSDPFVIDLFLSLMRKCYTIDENKFRCTVLCRADQDIPKLEKFWRKITNISKSQFYKTRIDARTIGKPSRKLDYRGVCRIDYFSADVFLDLMTIPRVIHKGP